MNSSKKKKTGSLIVLALEIGIIITLHTLKINRSPAAVQQIPAGFALSNTANSSRRNTANSSRHLPELLEDGLALLRKQPL
jgi:hypothetical protein